MHVLSFFAPCMAPPAARSRTLQWDTDPSVLQLQADSELGRRLHRLGASKIIQVDFLPKEVVSYSKETQTPVAAHQSEDALSFRLSGFIGKLEPGRIKIHLTSSGLHFLRGKPGEWLFEKRCLPISGSAWNTEQFSVDSSRILTLALGFLGAQLSHAPGSHMEVFGAAVLFQLSHAREMLWVSAFTKLKVSANTPPYHAHSLSLLPKLCLRVQDKSH
ncbi:cytoplasmic dynein 1 intermediate chain 1-like [Tachysurus ichikawai]